uniref:Sterol regulatory element-binding protein cleavage-activating protein n=1 Tax=Cacopsylla melanoneura TaxID=428564 RepID=A0A8D8Y4M7_9HEMI
MANPRWAETSVPKYLPDRVAQLYYAHGLFCSSHPYFVFSGIIFIVFFCCYPLLHVQFQSNIPQYFLQATYLTPLNSTNYEEPPRWFSSDTTFCYIQQIILRGTVSPWTNDLILTDAIRAPLAESFKLVELISNFQDKNSSLVLNDLCLHVEQVKRKTKKTLGVLPEYSCLLLSPANLWQQDIHMFQKDLHLISTIFNNHDLNKAKVTLSEILFGINIKDTGIRRYSLRNKQRIIQFSVTLFMTKYDKSYINGLKEHLSQNYPLHQEPEDQKNQTLLHIYYPAEWNYHAVVPLAFTYLSVFFYIYFSVGKMELIKSKVSVALSAVAVVMTAFFMTMGICYYFQLELDRNGRGKEVLPYFIIIVGLENILVLTKSIISIPSHLDSKIRVAQGLSKEGWSITKNFFLEITVLTAGLLTFFPVIQEICIFGVIAVVCDLFLQMVFFVTVLSLDIRSFDPLLSTDTPRTLFQYQYSFHSKIESKPLTRLSRSKSLSKIIAPNVISTNQKVSQQDLMPKRVKVIHLWAKTRIVQRMLMFGMVLWIGGIVYSIGLVHFAQTNDMKPNAPNSKSKQKFQAPLAWDGERRAAILEMEAKLQAAEKLVQKNSGTRQDNSTTDDLSRLKLNSYQPWKYLHPQHWLAVISLYNISRPHFSVTMLPPIYLSHVVSPERAIVMRNPHEKSFQFKWQSLAKALDPLDFSELNMKSESHANLATPFIPQSPMELFLASLLCIISVIVVAYGVYVIYRCVCTKNYAEWRSSWTSNDEENNMINTGLQVVLEAVPIPLIGHPQEVECIATDGNIVISSCLSGEIRSWNAYTGEQIDIIHRTKKNKTAKSSRKHRKRDESPLSVTKNRHQNHQKKTKLFPDLQSVISTKFTGNSHPCRSNNKSYKASGFDFGDKMKNIYQGFQREKVNEKNVPVTTSSNIIVEPVAPNCDTQETTASIGDTSETDEEDSISVENVNGDTSTSHSDSDASSNKPRGVVWCLDCRNNVIALGCSSGHIELWEISSCKLKYVYKEKNAVGVTSLKIIDTYVVAARLSGILDFIKLTYLNNNVDQNETSSQFKVNKSVHRIHLRTGSAGSLLDFRKMQVQEEVTLTCYKVESTRAHHQPITVMECVSNRVITGSQDHTLKVYKLEDQQLLFTLHGHCGPITTLFIDGVSMMSGSGSQDGLLCVWDTVTGACMYSIQAHDGCIHALTYSDSYVISLGQDERLCVWDRFQGHLLSTIQLAQNFCSTMAMLTHDLLITSRRGSLVIINVRTAETVRVIKLGNADNCVFIHQITPLSDGIVCDYNNQLRIVRFPIVKDKTI